MSVHTIYGCYNRLTGEIEFADMHSGCEDATITGRLVRDGSHAGEIQITHDYQGCETQYYACYDRETGKFSCAIDDECCEGSMPISCLTCPGQASYTIYGTISGVIDCETGQVMQALSGTHAMDCYVHDMRRCSWSGIWYHPNDYSDYQGIELHLRYNASTNDWSGWIGTYYGEFDCDLSGGSNNNCTYIIYN